MNLLVHKLKKKKKKDSLLPSSAARRPTFALTWNTPMMIHRSSMSVLWVKLKPISGFFWALISCYINYLSPPTWYALSSSFKLVFVWMKRTVYKQYIMLHYLSILSKKTKQKKIKKRLSQSSVPYTVTEPCFFLIRKGQAGSDYLLPLLVLISLIWCIISYVSEIYIV